MRLLGIDYGRAKVGIALGEGFLSEPYKVIRYESVETLIKQINEIIKKEGIARIVIGVSESIIAKESEEFAKKLNETLNIPVDLQDETLSSADAQRISMELGINRKKRKDLEDAYAASIMLQSYLDSSST